MFYLVKGQSTVCPLTDYAEQNSPYELGKHRRFIGKTDVAAHPSVANQTARPPALAGHRVRLQRRVLFSRHAGGSNKVNSTTSSPVNVLMS
jgi:hypothetical protein